MFPSPDHILVVMTYHTAIQQSLNRLRGARHLQHLVLEAAQTAVTATFHHRLVYGVHHLHGLLTSVQEEANMFSSL